MTKKDYKEASLVIGRTVRIIKNTSRHSVQIGDKIIITRVCAGSPDYFYDESSVMYYPADIELCAQTKAEFNLEIKEVEKEIEDLKKKKSELEFKIKFMASHNADTYDENTFKAYSILQTLKKTKSDIEMAKAIADILK